HCTINIGFDALERIIFRSGDDLGGSSMDNIIYAVQGSPQTFFVAYITYEEPHTRVISVELGHFPLFHFIPGEYDQSFRVVLGKRQWHECMPERTGPASNQN